MPQKYVLRCKQIEKEFCEMYHLLSRAILTRLDVEEKQNKTDEQITNYWWIFRKSTGLIDIALRKNVENLNLYY